MKTNFAKVKIFYKSIENGAVGICLEILLSLFFILAGFIVCSLWWGISR